MELYNQGWEHNRLNFEGLFADGHPKPNAMPIRPICTLPVWVGTQFLYCIVYYQTRDLPLCYAESTTADYRLQPIANTTTADEPLNVNFQQPE